MTDTLSGAVDCVSVRSRDRVNVRGLATRVPGGVTHHHGLHRSAMTPTGEVAAVPTSGVLNVRERRQDDSTSTMINFSALITSCPLN